MNFCPVILHDKLLQDVQVIQPSDEMAFFRATVLKKTLLKKYVPLGSNAILHSEAVQKFIDRNEKLSDKFDIPNHRSGLFSAWQARLHDVFMSGDYQTSVLDLNSCFLLGKPGPGSTRGTRFTDFYRKMWTSDFTYTNELLVSHFETSLPDRWVAANFIRRLTHANRYVEGSSLTSVPKDVNKNRCICTEPAINMFYQLGAHSVISHLLKRHFNLDIRVQAEYNKNAARRGSIDSSNATIDLSDASDHIHYDLVKQLLPREVFRCLDVIRSPGFMSDGVFRRFNMISSMGNGFTFALMTLLLVSLLDVYLRTCGDRYIPLRDGVFGDDIILPAHHYDGFTQVLSDFGLIVNLDKSYSTGFFRESCGGDFYRGHNVRGVYIKGVTNEAEAYSAFNRLFDWSASTGIHLPNVLLYLKGLVIFRPVPIDEADDSGIRIPLELLSCPKRDCNGSVYYRPFVAVPSRYRLDDRVHNFHGALIAFLGGYARGQSVMFRSNGTIRYKVSRKPKVTPQWDYDPFPTPGLTIQARLGLWSALVAD